MERSSSSWAASRGFQYGHLHPKKQLQDPHPRDSVVPLPALLLQQQWQRGLTRGRRVRSLDCSPSEPGFLYRLLLRCLPSTAILVGAGQWCRHRPTWRQVPARSARVKRAARPLVDLLPPGTDWPELQSPQQDVDILVAELEDLDRVVEIVEDAFKNPRDERPQLQEGAAGRLGASQAIIAGGSALRQSVLSRPVPLGSCEVVETGLILSYWDVDLDEIIAQVDISVWPYFVIPRIYGARRNPTAVSKPYISNLAVDVNFRRRSLAGKLMAVAERVVSDIWGDDEIHLHVEKENTVAQAFWEASGYLTIPMRTDPDFPLTEAEFEKVRSTIWRAKKLNPPETLLSLPSVGAFSDGADDGIYLDDFDDSEEDGEDYSWLDDMRS